MLISNTTLLANIVVFLDNNIYLKEHKQTFHQLIKKAYLTANDAYGYKEVIFVSIGNGYLKYAENVKTAERIYTFENDKHFIAKSFNDARHRRIISSETESIVIISSMEPSLTNQSNSFQFKSADYEDILKWYHIISQWLREDISIHVFLLNDRLSKQLSINDLTNKSIEKELLHLVGRSRDAESLEKEISFITKTPNTHYIKDQEFNRDLIYSALLSVSPIFQEKLTDASLSEKFYLTQILPQNFDNIIYSLEEIIDPAAVRKLKVKIEIDPSLINFDYPNQEYVRNYLNFNLLTGSTKRMFEYQILNGPTKRNHDPLFHYHFRIMRAPENRKVNIILTNKAITLSGKKYLMKEESRNVLNKSYGDIEDLIDKIMSEVEHLLEYQESDFPLSEKRVLIKLKSENKDLLKGRRLLAIPKKMLLSATDRKKKVSTKIDDNGTCLITLQINTHYELFFNYYSCENVNVLDKDLIFIGEIEREIGQGNEISIESNINYQLKTVSIKNSSKLKGKILFTTYNVADYDNLHTISISEKQTPIVIDPCTYFYSVLFNYSQNSCLNTWLIPIQLSSTNSQIIVNCIDDQLNNSNHPFDIFDEMISEIKKSMDSYSAPPVLGKNELTGTFESHLLGSPHFFIRLFQYTSKNDPTGQTIEMKELWRRIYYAIFNSSKFPKNLIPVIFENAVKNLLNDTHRHPPIIKKFLKYVLEKYFQDRSSVNIGAEDRKIYNYKIIETFRTHSNLDKKFIKKILIK